MDSELDTSASFSFLNKQLDDFFTTSQQPYELKSDNGQNELEKDYLILGKQETDTTNDDLSGSAFRKDVGKNCEILSVIKYFVLMKGLRKEVILFDAFIAL
jgi:hypothetical protein